MSRDELPRISITGNGGVQGGYLLKTEEALADLARLGDRLQEGMHVMLNDNDELEIEAILTRDGKHWRASTISGFIAIEH